MRGITKSITLSLIAGVALLSSTAAQACPRCRPFVNAGVYNPHFAGHLLVVLLPVAVLLSIGIGLYFIDRLPKAFRG